MPSQDSHGHGIPLFGHLNKITWKRGNEKAPTRHLYSRVFLPLLNSGVMNHIHATDMPLHP